MEQGFKGAWEFRQDNRRKKMIPMLPTLAEIMGILSKETALPGKRAWRKPHPIR
jgi:hypothetical protein